MPCSQNFHPDINVSVRFPLSHSANASLNLTIITPLRVEVSIPVDASTAVLFVEPNIDDAENDEMQPAYLAVAGCGVCMMLPGTNAPARN